MTRLLVQLSSLLPSVVSKSFLHSFNPASFYINGVRLDIARNFSIDVLNSLDDINALFLQYPIDSSIVSGDVIGIELGSNNISFDTDLDYVVCPNLFLFASDAGIETDSSWKCSAVASSNWYMGGFDDSAWSTLNAIDPSEFSGCLSGSDFRLSAKWIGMSSSSYVDSLFCRLIVPSLPLRLPMADLSSYPLSSFSSDFPMFSLISFSQSTTKRAVVNVRVKSLTSSEVYCSIYDVSRIFRSPTTPEILRDGQTITTIEGPEEEYQIEFSNGLVEGRTFIAYCTARNRTGLLQAVPSNSSHLYLSLVLDDTAVNTPLPPSMSLVGGSTRYTDAFISVFFDTPGFAQCVPWLASTGEDQFVIPQVIDPETLKPLPSNYKLLNAVNQQGESFWSNNSLSTVVIAKYRGSCSFRVQGLRAFASYWIYCRTLNTLDRTSGSVYAMASTPFTLITLITLNTSDTLLLPPIIGITIDKPFDDKRYRDPSDFLVGASVSARLSSAGTLACELLAIDANGKFENPYESPQQSVSRQLALPFVNLKFLIAKYLQGTDEATVVIWCYVEATAAGVSNSAGKTGLSVVLTEQLSYQSIAIGFASLVALDQITCGVFNWLPEETPTTSPPLSTGALLALKDKALSVQSGYASISIMKFVGLMPGTVYDIQCGVMDGSSNSILGSTTITVFTEGPRPLTGSNNVFVCSQSSSSQCSINYFGFGLSGNDRLLVKEKYGSCSCFCISTCSDAPVYGLDGSIPNLLGTSWCFVDAASSCEDRMFHHGLNKYLSIEACKAVLLGDLGGLSVSTTNDGLTSLFGVASSLVGGFYYICYCSGSQGYACAKDNRIDLGAVNFSLQMGTLLIQGTWYCPAGAPNCKVSLERYPLVGQVGADRLQIRSANCECQCTSQCSRAIINGIVRLSSAWCYVTSRSACSDSILEYSTRNYVSQIACKGVAGVVGDTGGISQPGTLASQTSNSFIVTFGFGTPAILGSSYYLCHCLWPCQGAENMIRPVGSLSVRGPTEAQQAVGFICIAGKTCSVSLTATAAPMQGDAITFCDDYQVQSSKTKSSEDGIIFEWSTPLFSVSLAPKNLCWCPGGDCIQSTILCGFLSVMGPSPTLLFDCLYGVGCQIPLVGVPSSFISNRDLLALKERGDTAHSCSESESNQKSYFFAMDIGSETFQIDAFSGVYGSGKYSLCWCRPPCLTISDYTVDAGVVTIIGPVHSSFQFLCFRAQFCSVKVEGLWRRGDVIAAVEGSTCSTAKKVAVVLEGVGVSNGIDLDTLTFSWPNALSASGGTYQLCWAAILGSNSFTVPVGKIKLRAPQLPVILHCEAFSACRVTLLGSNLDSSQDKLVTSPSCGAASNLASQSVALWGTDTEVHYEFQVLLPSIRKLCWCGGLGCDSAFNFTLAVGTLFVAGIDSVQTVICYDNVLCDLYIKGIDLTRGSFNNTWIGTGRFCKNLGDSVVDFSKVVSLSVVDDTHFFSNGLGKLVLYPDDPDMPAAPFSVPLCWCPSNLFTDDCLTAGTLQVRTYQEYYTTFVEQSWSRSKGRTLSIALGILLPVLIAAALLYWTIKKNMRSVVNRTLQLIRKGVMAATTLTSGDPRKKERTSTYEDVEEEYDEDLHVKGDHAEENDDSQEIVGDERWVHLQGEKLHQELLRQRAKIEATLLYKKVHDVEVTVERESEIIKDSSKTRHEIRTNEPTKPIKRSATEEINSEGGPGSAKRSESCIEIEIKTARILELPRMGNDRWATKRPTRLRKK